MRSGIILFAAQLPLTDPYVYRASGSWDHWLQCSRLASCCLRLSFTLSGFGRLVRGFS